MRCSSRPLLRHIASVTPQSSYKQSSALFHSPVLHPVFIYSTTCSTFPQIDPTQQNDFGSSQLEPSPYFTPRSLGSAWLLQASSSRLYSCQLHFSEYLRCTLSSHPPTHCG